MNKSYSTPDISRSRWYSVSDLSKRDHRRPSDRNRQGSNGLSKNHSSADLEGEERPYSKPSSYDASRGIKVKRRIIRRSKHSASSSNLHQQQQQQSDDDAGGVCRNHSSSPGRKKKMRRIRRSCPVHGKQHLLKKYGEKAFDMPEFRVFLSRSSPVMFEYCDDAVATLPAVHEEEPVCTCDSKDPTRAHCGGVPKKSANTKGRIDPPQSNSKLNMASIDEFHRLIYENEPLFSDMEQDPEVDLQIKEESDRYHKRSTQAFKNVFSSALCYNSSTMMKFAIIQNEVRNLMEGHLKVVRSVCAPLKLTVQNCLLELTIAIG